MDAMDEIISDETLITELPYDVLFLVSSLLDGQSLHNATRSCRHLASEKALIKSCTIPVTNTTDGNGPMSATSSSLVRNLVSLRIVLPPIEAPPALTRSQRASSASHQPRLAHDSHSHELPLDRWIDEVIGSISKGVQLQWASLRIKRPEGHATPQSSIGLSALVRIAAGCALGPGLTSLQLPYLSPTACKALPYFSSLTSISLVLADGTCLDELLKIRTLQRISLMTCEGLLYLILSLDQIERISQLSHLKSLSLQNVFLNDCHMTWEAFKNLNELQELRVSSPLSVARLLQLPRSLTNIQLPYFSNGGINPEPLEEACLTYRHSISNPLLMLRELRCKQTITEGDLSTLGRYFLCLESITIENIALSQTTLDLIQTSGFASRGLPTLPSVTSLRMTGHHRHWQVLGLLFPLLETLEVQSVEAPPINTTKSQLMEIRVVPLPVLSSLIWPVGKALLPVLLASPMLKSLKVMSINCAQRLDDLFRLPHPMEKILSDSSSHRAKVLPSSVLLDWWPEHLAELELGFCSSSTFRPKTICRAIESAPALCHAKIKQLVLRDHGPLAIVKPKQAMASGVMASRTQSTSVSDETGRVVDGSVVASALSSFRNLSALTIIGAKSLDGAGLTQAASKSSFSLKTLRVEGCPKLSKIDLLKIPGLIQKPHLNVEFKGFAEDIF